MEKKSNRCCHGNGFKQSCSHSESVYSQSSMLVLCSCHRYLYIPCFPTSWVISREEPNIFGSLKIQIPRLNSKGHSNTKWLTNWNHVVVSCCVCVLIGFVWNWFCNHSGWPGWLQDQQGQATQDLLSALWETLLHSIVDSSVCYLSLNMHGLIGIQAATWICCFSTSCICT